MLIENYFMNDVIFLSRTCLVNKHQFLRLLKVINIGYQEWPKEFLMNDDVVKPRTLQPDMIIVIDTLLIPSAWLETGDDATRVFSGWVTITPHKPTLSHSRYFDSEVFHLKLMLGELWKPQRHGNQQQWLETMNLSTLFSQ